jgi:cytochrome c oxidase subunit 3
MADVAVQHSVAGAYEPSLFGTYSKKIGMWLFLLSDSLTFGALLFAYSYGRISTPNWPTPFGKSSIINATIMTVCLLSSSLTMVLGVLASKKGDHKATVKWLLGWLLTPATNVFHIGIHVLLLVAIVSAVILVLKPKVYDAHDVEIAGLYWHFVDLVWMFIFPLVYLMSTKVV